MTTGNRINKIVALSNISLRIVIARTHRAAAVRELTHQKIKAIFGSVAPRLHKAAAEAQTPLLLLERLLPSNCGLARTVL
jgi:hypothetical protein